MLALIFDSIGVGEWFVLLAVILIVVGPKRLPSTARKFGQYYAKFRRAAESFKRQIMDMDSEFTSSIKEAAAEMDPHIYIFGGCVKPIDLTASGREKHGLSFLHMDFLAVF